VIRVARTDDVEEVREMHSLAFPGIVWPGDDHELWLALQGGAPVGFASAKYTAAESAVFLSRGAVLQTAQGRGLQRRLIEARVRWAFSRGARWVWTYTSIDNYPSLYNLLRCGFRGTLVRPRGRDDPRHVLWLRLDGKSTAPSFERVRRWWRGAR
jgi:GNAT superfamily N-acetyltransferase